MSSTETTNDRVIAIAGSLGVHAAVILVLYLGLLRQPELIAVDAEGPAIEATLVSSPQQAAAAMRRMETAQKAVQTAAPKPQPLPEPKPQDAPQPQQLVPQAQIPKPETVNQDEVRRAAELAALEKQTQEQDEKHKQAQRDLDNKQEQLEAENRQRMAQQETERQQQIDAKRKELADALRQVKLQEQKLKQIADAASQNNPPALAVPNAQPAQPSGNNGNMSLLSRYKKAIQAVANQNWHHDGVPERTHCDVHFKQLPGGEVFDVTFGDCPFDATARTSVEDALKMTPLPYAGFESVFLREGRIDMCYPEEACK